MIILILLLIKQLRKETSPKILKEPMPVQPMPCVMVLRLEPNMDPYTRKIQHYQFSLQFR